MSQGCNVAQGVLKQDEITEIAGYSLRFMDNAFDCRNGNIWFLGGK